MDVRNCPQCGRIYKFTGRALCPKCVQEDEKEFELVKQYLREHPGASIAEISEETEIEEQKVISYLRDGRLQLVPGQTGILLHCERCDVQILSGRYCDRCLKDIRSGFGGRVDPPKDQSGIRTKDDRFSIKNATIHTKDRFSRR